MRESSIVHDFRHIQQPDALCLMPHKPKKRYHRGSYLESCQAAHTLAQLTGKPQYLVPTALGYAIASRPERFCSYTKVTPDGLCTDYLYRLVEVA